ncbi:hypothetical protein ACFO9Q_11090 [Paenibacillus sp. GCM10023252]|uniref:hypothetical protein n=1 Tax=Paenibacillus sp. GCM10023252 TaxID=3252649 RepID=UPI00361A1754
MSWLLGKLKSKVAPNESQSTVDELTFKLTIEVKDEFKNFSKYKRIKVPVIYFSIQVFINDNELDQVFVEDQFLQSLLHEGKYPMFTCTCGIFDCGGYYIEVIHRKDKLCWYAEDPPFKDLEIKSSNYFQFEWENVFEFTMELVAQLDELNKLYDSKGLTRPYDLKEYYLTIEKLKKMRH